MFALLPNECLISLLSQTDFPTLLSWSSVSKEYNEYYLGVNDILISNMPKDLCLKPYKCVGCSQSCLIHLCWNLGHFELMHYFKDFISCKKDNIEELIRGVRYCIPQSEEELSRLIRTKSYELSVHDYSYSNYFLHGGDNYRDFLKDHNCPISKSFYKSCVNQNSIVWYKKNPDLNFVEVDDRCTLLVVPVHKTEPDAFIEVPNSCDSDTDTDIEEYSDNDPFDNDVFEDDDE